MKSHVYRPGDRVRIVNPKFVRRVGYPLVWHEVTDEQLYGHPAIMQALRALGLARRVPFGRTAAVCDDIPRHLQIAFAKEYVLQHKFGGPERTLHYHDPDAPRAFGDPRGGNYPLNWDCGGAEVLRKRVVKTGTYFPPYVPGAWAGPDAEGDPGGLENIKTHVLLDLGSGYEIEACNVEPWK